MHAYMRSIAAVTASAFATFTSIGCYTAGSTRTHQRERAESPRSVANGSVVSLRASPSPDGLTAKVHGEKRAMCRLVQRVTTDRYVTTEQRLSENYRQFTGIMGGVGLGVATFSFLIRDQDDPSDAKAVEQVMVGSLVVSALGLALALLPPRTRTTESLEGSTTEDRWAGPRVPCAGSEAEPLADYPFDLAATFGGIPTVLRTSSRTGADGGAVVPTRGASLASAWCDGAAVAASGGAPTGDPGDRPEAPDNRLREATPSQSPLSSKDRLPIAEIRAVDGTAADVALECCSRAVRRAEAAGCVEACAMAGGVERCHHALQQARMVAERADDRAAAMSAAERRHAECLVGRGTNAANLARCAAACQETRVGEACR